jgi:16S rRNA (adenine1518-N6/adenine1519-N6)-dimethyltransferase
MVQAEVADRISAQPGTKAYGAYTAKLALYGQVTGRFEVGPGNFMPPPHVDSAVVRIDRAPMPCEDLEDLGQVAQVIDAAFAQRRKTIRNSMAAKGFDKTVLDEAFAAAGIDPRARAESLSPADFVHLARAIAILGAGSIL